jgi:hypothetical protein
MWEHPLRAGNLTYSDDGEEATLDSADDFIEWFGTIDNGHGGKES